MKHLFRLTLLSGISLLVVMIFFGCRKPESSIGLGLQPESDMLTFYIDTLDLDMVTVREDSLATDELSTGVLGRVYHPRFGVTTAKFATQLRLSAPNINFGENAIADSMSLVLRLSGDAYGTLTPHYLMVQELVDTLDIDSTYYSNFNPEVGDVNLVDFYQEPVSINPSHSTVFSGDSLSAQIVLRMSNDFAQNILDQDTSTFSSNDDWLDFLPGILISSLHGQGATGIDISSGLSLMRLHYHNDVDTSFYDFIISPLSAKVNMFHHEFNGELAELTTPETDTSFVAGDDLLYVMSGSGVKIKLYIPDLEAVNDTLGPERAVQKAELILPVDESLYNSRYPAHQQLFIITVNEDGDPVSTPDQVSTGVNIDGMFDPVAMEYRFNISRTVQHILNRDAGYAYGNFSPDRDVPPLYIVSSRAGISIQGVVIKGTGVDENRARLVLTCSH